MPVALLGLVIVGAAWTFYAIDVFGLVGGIIITAIVAALLGIWIWAGRGKTIK
jgi:hypothetical protein